MWRKALSGLAFFIGFGLLAQGLYLPAKALVAQQLIKKAWTQTLKTGSVTYPWSWMDAYPIAELILPNSETHIVLNQDSGQALAFGPGVVGGAGLSGSNMTAIAAHKNTQFMSLKHIKTGDHISLVRSANERTVYRVTSSAVIDTRIDGLTDQGKGVLALITCYPFNAVSFNGPLRYVVFAEAIEEKTTPLS